MDERERYDKGLQTRRAILGDEYVERSLEKRAELTDEFQELLTRYAWGEIWSRPGLPRTTRSLITVAMLVALNRNEELRMHLQAALRNGVKESELKEVLLQAAIYCGVPAANSAFHAAQEILAGHAASKKSKR